MARRKQSKKMRGQSSASQQLEPLESRQLLSATVFSPSILMSPDRGWWGHGGGWGGWGGGGGGGGNSGGGSSGNGGTIISYYTPSNGYTPAQIQQAYGFNQISFNGVPGNGAGETIAIVDAYDDPNIQADLTTFDKQFSIAAPPAFTQVNQTGGPASSLTTNSGWALETALDVEWAHAMAPGASIELVEAKNANLNTLLSAVKYAADVPGVAAVSMSWGGGEFSSETSFDSYFTTPSGHTGVTFVAAAGDSGLGAGAEWPASSPNVLSVGGTTLLAANSSGSYGTESAWADGGGGLSQIENEPSYQNSAQSTGARATPDVSYNADPNTGYQVYDSVNYQGVKGWQEIGGTSAGTPQWAALVAIADQGRAIKSEPALDGATNTLPELYSAYSAPGASGYATYTSVFHDITTSETFFGGASAGYDLATGLGTPMASETVTVLTGGTVTPSAAPAVKPAVAPKPHTKVNQLGQDPAPPPAPSPVSSTASGPVSAPTTPPPTVAPVAQQAPPVAFSANAAVAVNPSFTPPTITTRNASGAAETALGLEVSGTSSSRDSRNALAIVSSGGTVSGGISSIIDATFSNALATTAATKREGAAVVHAAAPGVAAVLNAINPTAVGEAAKIEANIQAVAASPHVLLELSQLDASLFCDSMQAFAKESAALGVDFVRGGEMMAPITMIAAAVLFDVVLVGIWHHSRKRRHFKMPGLTSPGAEAE